MKETPIIFSGPMVRAILGGRKTQTRRPVKPQPEPPNKDGVVMWMHHKFEGDGCKNPPCLSWLQYAPCFLGDRLWARETWAKPYINVPQVYQADYKGAGLLKWRPSIHMPRWASRITLEVTGVRVDRVQDITEEDAKAEGITGPFNVGYQAYRIPGDSKPRYSCAEAAFEYMWDSIYGKTYPWDSNPWVWVISFTPSRKSRASGRGEE